MGKVSRASCVSEINGRCCCCAARRRVRRTVSCKTVFPSTSSSRREAARYRPNVPAPRTCCRSQPRTRGVTARGPTSERCTPADRPRRERRSKRPAGVDGRSARRRVRERQAGVSGRRRRKVSCNNKCGPRNACSFRVESWQVKRKRRRCSRQEGGDPPYRDREADAPPLHELAEGTAAG